MKNFESVAQMKLARLKAGQIVETKSYYALSASDTNGAACYKVLTPTEYGGTPDQYGDHTLANGNVAVLLLDGSRLPALQFGVRNDNTASADALEACIVRAIANGGIVFLPAGPIRIERSITGISNVTIVGVDRNGTFITASGNYTVFEFTNRVTANGFQMIQESGTDEGIAFGTPRSDASSAQAAYCNFENIRIFGFDFSWWLRASIWMTWKDCQSNSKVGIRFARNADPYDVLSDAPGGWNQFNPSLGWFHNVGVIENVNFEDSECGIYGCCMGYHIVACTTQRQSQDATSNTILPTTEEPTGVWLQSGNTGVFNAWNNSIESHYAEACRRPFYIQDQRRCQIYSVFVQGDGSGTPFDAPLVINQSIVYTEAWTGQDWFDDLAILTNGAVLYGRTAGSVSGSTYSIDATSMHYPNREQEEFQGKYSWTFNGTGQTKLIPGTLTNFSHYELLVGVLNNGSNVGVNCFDIFRWNSDGNTEIQERSATGVPAFTLAIKTGQIEFTSTNANPNSFSVVLRRVSDSIGTEQAI